MQPLQVEHAREMAKVLSDPDLYTFTGGEPPSVDVLEARYRRQLAGPDRTDEQWFNWVIRHDDELVGYVQTTVTGSTAEIAWVIGTDWQGRGYAHDAVGNALADVDAGRGADDVLHALEVLHVHRGHHGDAGGEDLLDVLPALLVLRAGRVRVRQLVDDDDVGPALQDGVEVHLLDDDVAVVRPGGAG